MNPEKNKRSYETPRIEILSISFEATMNQFNASAKVDDFEDGGEL
ncbi:MAG: hypothetical protein SPI35_07560 [Porphyromonas sp.]|nr:hypothetical protein [Porphyromonas sp.]